ncbi:MAG: hypothetical protein M1826_007577 [Phylliscum demangeonii]|nr:MAG: hypothetical protein M1826_007577 [Phylliscum demangeonii]
MAPFFVKGAEAEVGRDNQRAVAEYKKWFRDTTYSENWRIRHNRAVQKATEVAPKQTIYVLFKGISDPQPEGDHPRQLGGGGSGKPPAEQQAEQQAEQANNPPIPIPPPSSGGRSTNSNAFELHSLSITKPAPLHHLQAWSSLASRLWQFGHRKAMQVDRGVGRLVRSWHVLPQARTASSSAAPVEAGGVRQSLDWQIRYNRAVRIVQIAVPEQTLYLDLVPGIRDPHGQGDTTALGPRSEALEERMSHLFIKDPEVGRDNQRAAREFKKWSGDTTISENWQVRYNYAVRKATKVAPKQTIFKKISDPYAEEGDHLRQLGAGAGTPPAEQANNNPSTPPPPPSSGGPNLNTNGNAFELHSLTTKPAPFRYLQARPSFGTRLWQFGRHQVQQVHRGVGGLARSWHLLPQTRSASSSAAAVEPGPVRALLLHPE